jgi:hypothetical protein
MTNNQTARRLYFVAGKVVQSGAEYSVWGAHLWADSAADARAIAAEMTARDRATAASAGMTPLADGLRFVAKPSKSNPANAMNFY